MRLLYRKTVLHAPAPRVTHRSAGVAWFPSGAPIGLTFPLRLSYSRSPPNSRHLHFWIMSQHDCERKHLALRGAQALRIFQPLEACTRSQPPPSCRCLLAVPRRMFIDACVRFPTAPMCIAPSHAMDDTLWQGAEGPAGHGSQRRTSEPRTSSTRVRSGGAQGKCTAVRAGNAGCLLRWSGSVVPCTALPGPGKSHYSLD